MKKVKLLPCVVALPYDQLAALRDFLLVNGGRLLDEVDLQRAAEILAMDYFSARRLIVDQRAIPYRRKTPCPKSPVLVRIADLQTYKEATTIPAKEPRKKRRSRADELSPTDIMLGALG